MELKPEKEKVIFFNFGIWKKTPRIKVTHTKKGRLLLILLLPLPSLRKGFSPVRWDGTSWPFDRLMSESHCFFTTCSDVEVASCVFSFWAERVLALRIYFMGEKNKLDLTWEGELCFFSAWWTGSVRLICLYLWISTDFEAWIYIIYKKRKRRRIGSVFVLPYVVGGMSARMRENSFALANVFFVFGFGFNGPPNLFSSHGLFFDF